MKELGIYIHIPYCLSKCYYCDFNSFTKGLGEVNRYIDYLKKEIDLYSYELSDHSVNTIFIGGGTPSIIDARHINDILEYIYKKFNTRREMEITIESNPKTLDNDKLNIYRTSGVNRISMGVQSLDDRLLKRIGRVHSRKDFLKTYELVRSTGFNNINLDIMFNLPDQSLKDVIDTLKQVILLDPEHISFYSLKVEEGTPFYKQYINNELKLPDEDIEREMYHRGLDILKDNGYIHYEISNLAKKDLYCKHNLIYWKVIPYLGLGLSSHSNIRNERFNNYSDFNRYYESIDRGITPVESKEVIDVATEKAEFMILGLRLTDGVSKKEFEKRFKTSLDDIYGDSLAKLKEQELITVEGGIIKLTKLGLDVSNLVFSEFI